MLSIFISALQFSSLRRQNDSTPTISALNFATPSLIMRVVEELFAATM